MEEELKPGQKALIAESEEKNSEEKSEEEEKAEETPKGTPYSGKFKQFKTVEEFEQSYTSSFAEAARLNEQINSLEAEKKALKEDKGTKDEENDGDDKIVALEAKISLLENRVVQQEEKQRQEDERDFNDWMIEHPDLKDNAPLTEELLEELESVARKAAKKKEVLSMKEALTRSWSRINPNRDDGEEAGAKKIIEKEMASSPAPSGAPKSETNKGTLTESERKTAKIYGMTDEEYLDFKRK